jgi:plasmid replication initiation protein
VNLVTEETVPSTIQEVEPQPAAEAVPTQESQKVTEEEAIEFLKEMQENAGQMSELEKEEENIVNEFFNSLLKILKPFGKTLEISVDALPKNFSEYVNKAYLDLSGQLVLFYKNGNLKILNLADRDNHEVLIEISGEVMMRLKSIVNSYKLETEKRVKFLLSITKELQKVAKVFAKE